MRVTLMGGVLALVVCVSATDYSLFPNEKSAKGDGSVGSYLRYESTPVAEPNRSRGSARSWVLPVAGVMLGLALLGGAVMVVRSRRRTPAAVDAGPARQPSGVSRPGVEPAVTPKDQPIGDVAAQWRRVEHVMAGRGGRLDLSRTATSTADQAIAMGAPAVETRTLATLYDLSRYSGQVLAGGAVDEACRLADAIVGEVSS